jgi:hypothetical protein
MAAAAPAIVTEDALLRFDPLMVTWVVPACPLVGVKLLIAGFTVKLLALVAVPTELVTVIFPVVAPAGTVAVIFVAEFMTNVACVLLNATAVAVLKFVPLIVTAAPTAPLVGEMEVIVGEPETVTVNEAALVPVPPDVVTLIEPLVAVEGTVAVIWVEEFTVKLAVVPLNFTELAPVKFVPVSTTEAPVGPLVGAKEAIVGPVRSVKL